MMSWGNGMGGWSMVLMGVGNVLFWGLLIAGVVLFVRAPERRTRPDPRQVLRERFARGEIDEEEYAYRLHVLAGPPPPS